MNPKKNLLFLLFILLVSNTYSKTYEVWESNVAIVPESELFGIIQQSFNINVDGFIIKSSQQTKLENIAFLMRFPNHRSLEEISKKYKHLVTSLNEQYPIDKVKFDNDYSVYNQDENTPFLTIKISPGNGWGADKDSYTLLRESYLATGNVTEESMQWVRITPKKNKDYYEKSLLWSTLTKPRDFEIIQLNPDRWLYSYTYKEFYDSGEPKVKSVIYSEKYGVSIIFEALHSSNVNDVSMKKFSLKMAEKIFDEVEEKGIIPSPKYVYFMTEMRKKRTGSNKLPSFVVEECKPVSSNMRKKRHSQAQANKPSSNTNKQNNQAVEIDENKYPSQWIWISGILLLGGTMIFLWVKK